MKIKKQEIIFEPRKKFDYKPKENFLYDVLFIVGCWSIEWKQAVTSVAQGVTAAYYAYQKMVEKGG